MRELLAKRLVAPASGRLLDAAGGDALVATAALGQDPGCSVLVTCGDLRPYRAVKGEAGKAGARAAVMLSDGLEDVEESDWDAIALTISPHLPPVLADRLVLQAAMLVKDDGALWLATNSKAGKRVRRTAALAFGPGQKVGSGGGQRVDRHSMSDSGQRLEAIRQRAQDLAREARAEVWLELPGTRLRFETRVGLFAYRAVDPGTHLLLEWALRQAAAERILDVGCGYGVIGLAAAATWGDSQVDLVDVDLRSVRLAESNAALNGLTNCTVSLADAAADLPATEYGLALSNLPAHEGREPTLRLLEGVRHALRPSGTYAAVVPPGSGLRQLAQQVFGQVQVVTQTAAYEVVLASGDR